MHTIYPASYTLVGTFQTFTGGISNIKVANVATLQTVASYIKGENVLCWIQREYEYRVQMHAAQK